MAEGQLFQLHPLLHGVVLQSVHDQAPIRRPDLYQLSVRIIQPSLDPLVHGVAREPDVLPFGHSEPSFHIPTPSYLDS